MSTHVNITPLLLKKKNKQEAHRPYGHLSIRDFTLTSCQRGTYLHIKSPIIIIYKNQQLYRKAAS